MTDRPHIPAEPYEPPLAEDIDTSTGPAATAAMVIQQSPPQDSAPPAK